MSVGEGITQTAPSVVAVVVTRNPGAWLEGALESLAGQDYPDLTVLVIDAGSDEDPTPRVAEILPQAYVRRLEANPGFAGAANEALTLVEGAAFYCLCHDDVAFAPDAVRLMVEEAYRSNAAVVGPKLVEDADPRVLLEVGMSIDRFGAGHSEIEPGELDQEQHDAVRDVFYVSSAAMLVRADLFAELGGFDPAAHPGSEDLDLCWRARIAGARVMVVPDATARHREAAAERGIDDVPTANELERTRLRSVLVSYSRLSLVWLLPWAMLHTLVESIVFLATRPVDRAVAVWRAWFANLRVLGEVRRARRRAQALRRVPDREPRPLQVRGSARARRFVTQRLRTEETISLLGDTSRAVADRAQSGARQPIFLALALAALVFAFGSRSLFFDGIPQIGQFAEWSSFGDLASAFGSGWRDTMLGSPTPAPPALGLMAAASALLLGATGLAQTIVVLACLPVGVVGVMRLVRAGSGEWVSGAAAGIAYVLLPVWRNAMANGRMGPLLVLAVAPFLVHLFLAVAGARPDGGVGPSGLRRRWFGLVVLGAVLTALYPPALFLGIALALALALAAPLTGGLRLAGRSVVATVVAALGAFVLLFPWPLAMALGGVDAGAWGFGFRPNLAVGEIVRMASGPAGSRWSSLGVLIGALLVLSIARGPRLVWGIRSWSLALVGFLATWLSARFGPGLAVPAPEATLAVFALGVAAAVGFGVAAFVEDLRGQHFGWRQGVSLAAFVAVAVSSFGMLGDAANGRWHAPRRDWPSALAFASGNDSGSFRILWVGDPAVLPYEPVVGDDGIGYVLTVDGAGDATDVLRAPATDADALLGDAIERARDGSTARLGRILAPMSVRYVIVPERVGPRSGTRALPPRDLVAGLDDQVDLAKLVRAEDDAHVYQNASWIPMGAVLVDEPESLRDADPERTDLILLSEPDAPDVEDAPDDEAATDDEDAPDDEAAEPSEGTTGTVLWSQAANDGWRADLDGEDLDRFEAFGWATAFEVDLPAGAGSDAAPDPRVRWGPQWQRNATVTVQILVAAAVVWLGWRRTRPSRSSRRAGTAAGPPADRGRGADQERVT